MIDDASWQVGKVYRGYKWGKFPGTDIVHPNHLWYADGREAVRDKIHEFSARYHHPPKQSWQQAHDYRRSLSLHKYVAYDFVPWEIHEIEDELAYHHALASYLIAVDHHPYAETYDQIIDSLKIWL